MAMKLDKVVPFGRSLDEYRKMFSLTDTDLDQTILGVGDGPASFNAEMFALGKSVLSVDPLYLFPAEAIEKQFHAVVDDIIAQVKSTPDDWVWTYHASPEHLQEHRTRVLRRFIADFERGKAQGRYRIGELPALDLAEQKFNLALCSHFLFLYSDHFSFDFHWASIREMLRVATEVRIFPLLTLMREKSPYVQPLIEQLKAEDFVVTVEKVGYEMQRGGNEMMRVRRLS